MDARKVYFLLLASFFAEITTGTRIGYINPYPQYRIEDNCEKNESIIYTLDPRGPKSGAMILASSSTRTAKDRNCAITVRAPSNNNAYGIVLTVRKFHFHSSKSECPARLKIFLDGNETKTVCTVPQKGESFSTLGALKIVYHTTADARLRYQSDFLLIVTAYKQKMSYMWCGYGKFSCGNGRCIWNGLLCDGYDNCGDSSDEDEMGISECFRSRLYWCNVLRQKYHKSCDELQQLTTEPVRIVNVGVQRINQIGVKSMDEMPSFDLMAVVMNHSRRIYSTSEVQTISTENTNSGWYRDSKSTVAQTLGQDENISMSSENFTEKNGIKNESSKEKEEALFMVHLQQYMNDMIGKEEFLVKVKNALFYFNVSDSIEKNPEPFSESTAYDEKTGFKVNGKTYPWLIFLFIVLYTIVYYCVKRVYAKRKNTTYV